jgi:hypothetical protein
LFRFEDRADCIKELDRMAEMGEQFYQESGTLFKLLGVLRAADMFWNPDKRYGTVPLFLKIIVFTLPC